MLLNAIADPFTVGDVRVELRASAGVVVWDGTSRSPNEFIRDADVAVDEAKSLGRARHVVFTPLMHEQAINRFAIVQDLHQALEHDEIVMHYQPIFDLATAEIVGYEALMRWHHPEHGWVAPSEFIPLAEQSGMILELGDLALRAATTDASSWPASGTTGERPFVTVNLSASQFHDPRLVATIEGVLATSAIASARLVIEITEGVLLSDTSETTNVLGRLHEIGVHFALDDFGTGFSSLSYLALLHPRIIKIDQSFVRLARPSSRNDALLETIISLGDKLGITTLAEGIETVAQYRHLRRLGCGLGQGFLFSPAVANQYLAALHFTVPVA
jgi:EAL domain-containing protein (putative c-di-GMP-specific phosphodiesterase class I)